MNKFFNLVKEHALSAMSNTGFSCDLGRITSYNPATRLVSVQIHPAAGDEPALNTGQIPLGSPWVGNGWGMFAAPAVGTLCVVLYQQGSKQIPISATPLFDGKNRPLNVPSEEFWLVHKGGAYLKLTNDGKVLISSASEVNVTCQKATVTASNDIDLNGQTVNVTASTACNVYAPVVKAGASGGDFQALRKADNSLTTNLQGS